MPVLTNPKHEAFAQARAKGKSADEAYASAGYSRHDGNAARLSGNERVRARVAELVAKQADKSELSRDDLRKWCVRVILAKPSEASEDSDICETIMTKAGPFTRVVDKLGAVDRLARLCGFNEPDKLDSSGKLEIVIRKL